MKEIVTRKYIADDGKEFENESECAYYELNLLYKASGFRFYKGRKLVKELTPSNDGIFVHSPEEDATSMTIDRSKKKENDAFIEHYRCWGELCYPVDAYDGAIDAYGETPHGRSAVLGSKYIATPEGLKNKRPIYETDMVCVQQVNKCPICGKIKTLKPYNHTVDEWGRHDYIWMCPDCHNDPETGKKESVCHACTLGHERYLDPCKSCKYAHCRV